MTYAWELLNSPLVVAALAAVALYLLNLLYTRKPAWQQYEGTIIAGVKWAEKLIPDESENKSINRLNAALQYVLRVYQETEGRRATAKVEAELREGIQIIHAELESAGGLS
jgi:hypothetical protein